MIKEEIKDKIISFILKNVQREKDKWESGMKNDYFAWNDAYYEIIDKINGYKKY